MPEIYHPCISISQISCKPCNHHHHDIGKLQFTDISAEFHKSPRLLVYHILSAGWGAGMALLVNYPSKETGSCTVGHRAILCKLHGVSFGFFFTTSPPHTQIGLEWGATFCFAFDVHHFVLPVCYISTCITSLCQIEF